MLEEQWKQLNREHEGLGLKYKEVEKERDELYSSFESTVATVHRKSDFKNLKLSKKLDTLTDDFNKKATQLEDRLLQELAEVAKP